MSLEKDIYRIINGSRCSTRRGANNQTLVTNENHFKGLTIEKTREIADMMDSAMLINAKAQHADTKSWTKFVAETKDAPQRIATFFRQGGKAIGLKDSVYNDMTGTGGAIDPVMQNYTDTNIWMSPWEANSLYSQKGLFEQIINKKAKSIQLNGLKIKNKMLTAKEIDQISLNMVKLDLPKLISDAMLMSLVYGGGLLFPMFKSDSPVSMHLPLSVLAKYGILKKGCIDRFIMLDRWNTNHLPATNPTQRDFDNPEKYFIPYLGCDVSGSRCARIVTGQQAGFYGKLITMGWGLPDPIGYAKEVLWYCATMQSVPTMIQQMSIVARTIDISGALASEGINAMDEIMKESSIKEVAWSPTNPIQLDMIGELSVINRNFMHLNELILLERQDLTAKAGIPEPMIFSSTKGNFSSGDDTQGNLAKQYETVKVMHKDVEPAFRQLAKILIIDALGLTDHVAAALPYTEIHFDEPLIANSTERAEIGKNLSDMLFQIVASQVPQDVALQLVSNFGGEEMTISSEILEASKKRQEEADARAKEKHEAEMALLKAQVENAKKSGEEGGSAVGLPKPKKEGKGYSKLEQEQHSKTRLGADKRPEQLKKNGV